MKYFVAWDIRFNTPKHFGTILIADDFFVLFDSNRKYENGISFDTPYEFKNGKIQVVEGAKSIVRVPNGSIEYEALSEEEFDSKYLEGSKMVYKGV